MRNLASMAADHSGSDSSAVRWRTLVATAEASLDGVIICAVGDPFPVVYMSRRAVTLVSGDQQRSRSRGENPSNPLTLRALLPSADDDFLTQLDHLRGQSQSGVHSIAIRRPRTGSATPHDAAGDGARATNPLQLPPGLSDTRLVLSATRASEWLWITVRSVLDVNREDHPNLNRDHLTGLANQREVRRTLLNALERVELGGGGFAVVCMDIDHFRRINHKWSQAVGDAVLVEIAARLGSFAPRAEVVGRLRNDEFVIVWPGVTSEAALAQLQAEVQTLVARQLEVAGHAMRVSMSAGAVIVTDATPASPDTLLTDADAARVLAKRSVGDGVTIFTPEMRAPLVTCRVTIAELRDAMRHQEFDLFAQPVLDVSSGVTTGVELLLRWHHPTLGLLAPDDFLELAESCDVADWLGEWVLDRAAAISVLWSQHDPERDFRIAVNLSPRQLASTDVVSAVTGALKRHGAVPTDFLLEITESVELASRPRTAEQVRGLLDLGLRVGIDDFGSGFANMSYLRDLPVDVIKVDRALVRLEPTGHEEAILKAVTSVARAIGADVVLEGVERVEQLELARRCGVKSAQGYLFGEPMPVGPRRPEGRFPVPN